MDKTTPIQFLSFFSFERWIFFFFWFPGLRVVCCLFFFFSCLEVAFFLFSFFLSGLWVWLLFCFSSFFCLIRHDFFLGHDFYFLINWVIAFFFFFWCGYLSLFFFNWSSFFNKGVWVNLYKLTFSISSLFHSQPNKNEKN